MIDPFRRVWGALLGAVPLGLALGIAAAAAWPALNVPGLVATRAAGDSPFLLQRTWEMSLALTGGHFPPRWMPNAAYGLGYPFWNFYAPLAYLVAGGIAALGGGVIGGIKVTVLLVFLVAAAGAFRLAEQTWGTRSAGLVASAAYTLAPYHLVNLYVRGDALSELTAFALCPWVLLAVDRVLDQPTAGAVAGLAMALALLLVSHNISALLFAPLLLAYLLWRGLVAWRSRSPGSDSGSRLDSGAMPSSSTPPPRPPVGVTTAALWPDAPWYLGLPATVLRALWTAEYRFWGRRPGTLTRAWFALSIGLLVGLAVSAWFWVPALLEAHVVQVNENLTGYFDYHGHFRSLFTLFDPGPMFEVKAGVSCSPCRIGLAQGAAAFLGVMFALSARRRARRQAGSGAFVFGPLEFWLAVAGVATLMMTPLSRPFWEILPLLRFAQFPWRWLSVDALALAMLAAPLGGISRPPRIGHAPAPSGESQPASSAWNLSPNAAYAQAGLSRHRGTLGAVAAAIILTGATLPSIPVVVLPIQSVVPDDMAAFELFSGNIGTTVRAEYLPQTVKPRPMSGIAIVEGHPGMPRPVPGFGTLNSATFVRAEGAMQEWQIRLDGPGKTTLAFPTLWFPGWIATVDNRTPRPTGNLEGSGWLTVDLDAAECPAPGGCLLTLRLDRSAVRAVAEGVSLLALLLCVVLCLVNPRRSWWRGLVAALLTAGVAVALARALPVAEATGPVTMDLAQTPYPHFNPGGVQFGQATLKEATIYPTDLTGGGEFLVNLRWEGAPEAWRVQADLVSPSEPTFGVPDTYASSEQAMGQANALAMTVPPDIHSGLFLIRLKVSNRGQTVKPRNAEGHVLDTIYLGPVRIKAASFAGENSLALAEMGDVSLMSASATQLKEQVEVRMVWKTAQPLTLDYTTSVRLVDSSGKTVAQEDKQPLYGFYPATSWPTNTRVVDRRWVDLPEDIEPGTYALQVVLYDGLTTKALGTGEVRGVVIQARPER